MVSALKVQALMTWLISGAPPQSDYDDTVAELARRLFDAGVEADILVLYQMPKNPLVGGHRRICTPGQAIQVRDFTHEEMETPYYKDGVVDRARIGGKPIRYIVGDNPELDAHAGSKSIIDAHYSEFSVIPLIAVNEEVRAAAGLPPVRVFAPQYGAAAGRSGRFHGAGAAHLDLPGRHRRARSRDRALPET